MRTLKRTLMTLGLAVVAILLVMPTTANADKSDKRVVAKTKKAMGEYDMMEFESAKSLLLEAIAIGERAESKGDVLAEAYLNLGIVYYSGLDAGEDAAESFANAIRLNKAIELGVAYSTPEMKTLLDEARSSLASASTGNCPESGFTHSLVDEAAYGTAPGISAKIGADLSVASVQLFFRSEGELEFSKATLSKKGSCEYLGNIPTRAVQGKFVHYYITAIDGAGKDIAHKGTAGSPNIIEVAASGGSVSITDEDPLLGGEEKKPGLLDEDTGPSVFVSMTIGSGGGYVQGPTEKILSEVGCCVGAAFLHLMPEVGYFLNPQLAISAAFRAGFPIGANVEGHATFAPAGLLRVRYILDPSGEGVQVSGSIGGGVIRNVVNIENASPGMDTDTTVMGPLLIGGALGYSLSIGGPIRLVAELNALAALTAGIKELGDCPGAGCVKPKNGLQIDANLAFQLAF